MPAAKKGLVKVVVIGKGRFGNAAAQGLRESFVVTEDGDRLPCEVIQVSAKTLMSLPMEDMAHDLQGAAFIIYCGTKLQVHAHKLACAMKEASKVTSGHLPEFIDFSNPDPIHEKEDVSGTIELWMALNAHQDEEASGAKWKIWKITEVGSVDVAGIEGNTNGIVYGTVPGSVPSIRMPGLSLEPAPPSKGDLFAEAQHRIMERAEVDCWYDGILLSIAMFLFTAMYAILRYSQDVNGSEPNSNIPMYLLDKAYAWTGLWMMVVSPFAGNLLALRALYLRFGSLPLLDKVVTLLSSLLMVIPTVFFSLTWLLWIGIRNVFFLYRGPTGNLYLGQSADREKHNTKWMLMKASLVDMCVMKGETGVTGFVYAFIHSFIGCIVCDVAYKGYWFNETNGRLHWRMELSMMTGCVSTVLLWAVAMRSLFGKSSWIRMKPLYAYLSPLGMWFAVVHVMAFGAKGWNTLFNDQYHNGQMSITFVSSMYPACTLLVHHIMGIFGTKKRLSGEHLWKHSMVNNATEDFVELTRRIATNPNQKIYNKLDETEHFGTKDDFSE